MVFNGIYPAPPLTVAPCGLLSVARVVKHQDDEHWVVPGFAEFDSSPSVTVLSNDGAVATQVSIPGANSGAIGVTPFWVELAFKETTVNFIREGLDGPYLDQIDAATQKAVEFELWEGTSTASTTPVGSGLYLSKSGGASVVTSAGVAPEKALYLIEQSIALSPTGGRGVIHMTRDVASALGSRLRYFEKAEIDEKTYAVTRLGTLVVIGSGYTGTGPQGESGSTASASNKWMYATGGVEVHLGRIDTTDIAKVDTNDFEVRATRPVAVIFDPSIFSAAQVTLP